MEQWKKEVERAKENIEKRAFVVEVDRDLPDNSSLRVIGKVENQNGKMQYKVVTEKQQDDWY